MNGNANFQRGLLLYEQGRYPQAEQEFRMALAAAPDNDPYPHALLALSLCQQQRFNEAEQEINTAFGLDPNFPYTHYAAAIIFLNRNRPEEALQAIGRAIELEPEDADFRALQAQAYLNLSKWKDALDSAQLGLQSDPEHVECTNAQAFALVKLGRKDEAGRTLDAALSREPDNSYTHANRGWALLHAGDHKKALEHFGEALRLDPTNEHARLGTVEALKAQNFVYALMLKYFLWMSSLSSNVQWAIIMGGFFGMRALRGLKQSNPDLAPYIVVVQILYVAFVFLTWTADALFNLLLRLNKFGRMILNRDEIVASNWVGSFVAIALVCFVGSFVSNTSWLILGAMIFAFGVLPVAGVFKCPKGWPRYTMAAYAALVVGLGIGGLFMIATSTTEAGADNGFFLITFFGIGIFLAGFVNNFLISKRVRK